MVTILHHHAESLVRKHKKEVKNHQLAVAHLADAAIQTYAGYCTLARALHFEESDTVGQELAKATISMVSDTARKHLYASTSKNHKQINELGKALLERDGYRWDVALDR